LVENIAEQHWVVAHKRTFVLDKVLDLVVCVTCELVQLVVVWDLAIAQTSVADGTRQVCALLVDVCPEVFH